MARTLTIDVPKSLWLTSNRHITHRGMLSRIRRGLQQLAAEQATVQRLQPLPGRYIATWTIHYPKGVRTDIGDAANAQPTTKALLDGLTPRWLADDGPKYVAKECFERGPNLNIAAMHRVVLTLQERPDE